ncbi:MAG: hypothetical protein A3I11_03445 [Elusimicrobia bacterium RIFCSPLOWO2_02_FULL_39_32]|nr:MAG: hypothetical protein A3B80_02015 [Elusimicrobia bacterium RIFCSPHIGHO2_02_FULL_39_36]OGR92762.1 MAG: hypothetical protein A3I11_03445 [Elusimicrobia bacterium RIFCSPLOWO2_02_FULL_39_32]
MRQQSKFYLKPNKMEEESMHLSYFKKSSNIENNSRSIAKTKLGGQRMKRSFVSSAIASVGAMLASFGLAAIMFLSISTRAEALTISVGTPTVINNTTVDQFVQAKDVANNYIHVFYTTKSATTFSIMLASNTANGSYTISTLSTGAINTTRSAPTYLNVVYTDTGVPHVYFYDTSSKTINYLVGTTQNQSPQFILGSGLVTASGLSANASGNGFLLVYSSLSADGSRYSLEASSISFGDSADTLGSFITVLSSGSGNIGSTGYFSSFLNSTNQQRGVVYYDALANALKLVNISAGAIVEARDTIDSGSMSNIYVIDAGNVTRIVYTNSSVGVKYAVQRRNISSCWYIQKIDDGDAQTIDNTASARGLIVSYVKSSNLWAVFGSTGSFFDDFSENITGVQLGKATLVSGLTTSKGGILNNPTDGRIPLGIFKHANGLASLNFLTLSGTVQDSYGTALSAVRVRSNITDGGAGAILNDLNPADSPTETEGGLTSSAGTYAIYVASGATMSVSASSGTGSVWAFVQATSHTIVSVSTASTGNIFSQAINVNFIGVSSPTFATRPTSATAVSGDISAGAPFVGVSITTTSVAWGLGDVLASSFTITSINEQVSNRFARGGNFRFAPSAADSISEDSSFLSTGTVTEFSANTAVASRHINVTSFDPSADSGINVHNGAAQFRSIAASTASATFPLTYTVVYTTKTGVDSGITMQGKKENALILTKFQYNLISQPNDGLTSSSGPVITSTKAEFVLISYSSNGPMFPRNKTGSGDSTVGTVFLTTTSNLEIGPDQIGGKISLTVAASSNSTIIRANGNIFGLKTPENTSGFNPWYVRISTNVNGVWHSAISPSTITFSTPTITAIAAQTGDSTLLISSAAATSVNINGTGLISGTTLWISTAPQGSILASGLPQVFAQNAIVNAFTVNSSSWATATFTPKTNATAGYYFYIGSGCVTGGGISNSDTAISVSTVIAQSQNISVNIASMSISSILLSSGTDVRTSSAVANTRSYDFTVNGWGLMVGSTISFVAVDGSSFTTAVALENVDSSSRTGTLSNVNFRGMSPGKFYTVTASTSLGNRATSEFIAESTVNIRGLASLSGGSVIYSPNALWVSSIAITTITTPIITDIPNGTLYNSTHNVVVELQGRGFVLGSSITFSISHANGNINFTTFTHTTGSETGIISNHGQSMRVTIPGTATVAGVSSGLFGSVSTGVFTVTLTTTIADAVSDDTNLRTAVGSLTLLASTVSSVSNVDNTNYATMQFGSFTITGVGLMDGTTAELYLDGSDAAKIGSASLTVLSVARTSATASFDLRSATGTGSAVASYSMVIDRVHPTAAYSNARLRSVATGISIASVPAVNSITPITGGNSGATTVTLYGRGLTIGTTVQAKFSPTSASTEYVAYTAASSATFSAALTLVDSTGTTATFSFPSGKMPGAWVISVSTTIDPGTYTGASKSVLGRTLFSTNTLAQFTVSESSAPNVPTGLTVLSAGIKTVTLQWIAPGDDGTTGSLTAGAGFIVYYSSGSSDRGQGCAPCYPVQALQGLSGTALTGYATNYNFANTWAQFLPYGHRNSALSTDTIKNSAPFNFSTSSTRGLVVSTQTLTIGTDSLIVNGTAGTGSIAPGATVQRTLTIPESGSFSSDGDFWFIVRAFDESGNISDNTAAYSTAAATIKASVSATVTAGDPTIDPNKDNTVTYTITEVSVAGVTVKELTLNVSAGSLDGSDKFTTPVVVTDPPADTPGVTGVGAALDLKLDSGKTEFKKAIEIIMQVNEGELINKLAGKSIKTVKLAYYNGSRWVIIKDSSLTAGGNVKGKTTHLTQFRVVIAAPASNLAGTVVYPNPFRPTVAAQLVQGITFDLMPVDSTIQIYTLAGDLVKQLKADATGIVNWNAKNEDGKDVASGVYFALIKGGGDKKTLKIAVQR